MARAATTSDVFNAIAEPRRREIVDLLALGTHRGVGEMVQMLGLPQPAVSKHLGVLRQVGVVAVHKAGRRRLYRLNPRELKPVYDWVRRFDRLWTDHLGSIKQAAELAAQKDAPSAAKTTARQPPARERAGSVPKPSPKEQRHDR